MDKSALHIEKRLFQGHWPIFCLMDETGQVLLCRETEAEAGEMLRDMEKAKGGGDQKSDHRCNDVTGDNPTLSEIGITKRQSSDWQRIAK